MAAPHVSARHLRTCECWQVANDMQPLYKLVLILWLFSYGTAYSDTSTASTIIGQGLQGAELKPGADLSRRNFDGTQLVRLDLSGAIFDNADLGGATFEECNLTGASFQDANLSGAIFIDNLLADANFTNASITDFRGQLYPAQLAQTRSFREKNLKGVTFSRKGLGEQTDLRGFDLRNATLLHGDFRDVQFDGARIAGASFEGKIDFEQLRNTAEVSRRNFPVKFFAASHCDFCGLNLRDANVLFAPGVTFDLTDAKIDYCWLRFNGHEVTEAITSTWSYKQRRLRSIHLSYCNLSGISFNEMILDHVWLSGVDLTGSTYRNTVFVRSKIESYGKAFSAAPLKETYNFKHGHLAEIGGLSEGVLDELADSK